MCHGTDDEMQPLLIGGGAVRAAAPADACPWDAPPRDGCPTEKSSPSASQTLAVALSGAGRLRPLSRWMGELLSDDLPLSMVSMLGTHNSGSYAVSSRRLPALVVAGTRCQSRNLDYQLRMGVRFLDLRARSDGTLSHGLVGCGMTLRDAFEACDGFLQVNPSEVIVARIKHEAGAKSGACNIGALVRSMRGTFPLYCERRLPLVGDVRGRIVVICDWMGDRFGLRWDGPEMQLQDEYWHSTGTEKFAVVKQALSAAEQSPEHFHIHFTSSTALPRKVPLTLARSVNRKLTAHLRTHANISRDGFIGVVVMDFPTVAVCELIIRRNQTSLDPCRPVCIDGESDLATYEELTHLQCQVMTTATRADAAAFVHNDQDELRGHVHQLSQLLVDLAQKRVSAELREPTVEEPPAGLWIVEGTSNGAAALEPAPRVKVPAAVAAIRSADSAAMPRLRSSSGGCVYDDEDDLPSPRGIPVVKIRSSAASPQRRSLMRRLGSSFFGRCSAAAVGRCTRPSEHAPRACA